MLLGGGALLPWRQLRLPPFNRPMSRTVPYSKRSRLCSSTRSGSMRVTRLNTHSSNSLRHQAADTSEADNTDMQPGYRVLRGGVPRYRRCAAVSPDAPGPEPICH